MKIDNIDPVIRLRADVITASLLKVRNSVFYGIEMLVWFGSVSKIPFSWF